MFLSSFLLLSAGAHTAYAQDFSSSNNAPLNGKPTKEILGFAPYWTLSSQNEWDYNVLTTISYFGISLDASGNIIDDQGLAGFNSVNFKKMLATAHKNHDKVLLTIKAFDNATIEGIVGNPANTQNAIQQSINLANSQGLDGITIDFEGSPSELYPNLSSDITIFTSQLNTQTHAEIKNSETVIATYANAATSDKVFNLYDLSNNIDVVFLMAYDFPADSTTADANAALKNSKLNDTQIVQDYLKQVPANKLILGVPYYGYKWSVDVPNAHANVLGPASAVTYSQLMDDFACMQNLQKSWDTPESVPWVSWYSPAQNDPCGGNLNTYREAYYENATSLGLKYDLVNNQNLRGAGIWALGFDSGHQELWDELSLKFITNNIAATIGGILGLQSALGVF